MSQIKGMLKEEMPREKLLNFGPQNLTDVELLAIILRVGTKNKNVLELSREIIEKFQVNLVSRKTINELLEFKGISKAKASQIVSVFELARRFANKDINQKKIQLNSSSSIFEYIKPDLLHLTIEKVFVIFLDSKNQVIKKEQIFEGGLNYSLIEIRKIIKKSLDYNANSFFLVHNHPSGDSTPSKQDIQITNKLAEASELMSIKFLDHLVIGDDYFSFFDNNLM